MVIFTAPAKILLCIFPRSSAFTENIRIIGIEVLPCFFTPVRSAVAYGTALREGTLQKMLPQHAVDKPTIQQKKKITGTVEENIGSYYSGSYFDETNNEYVYVETAKLAAESYTFTENFNVSAQAASDVIPGLATAIKFIFGNHVQPER